MQTAENSETGNSEMLQKMVAGKQLSASDAAQLVTLRNNGHGVSVRSEEEVLRWLAKEYDLGYTSLDEVEPDKEVLSLFPARILLKRNCCRCAGSTAAWKSRRVGFLPRTPWTPSRP